MNCSPCVSGKLSESQRTLPRSFYCYSNEQDLYETFNCMRETLISHAERSQKCLSQSETKAAILVFWLSKKNTNLVEEIFLPVNFHWSPFSSFRVKVKTVHNMLLIKFQKAITYNSLLIVIKDWCVRKQIEDFYSISKHESVQNCTSKGGVTP